MENTIVVMVVGAVIGGSIVAVLDIIAIKIVFGFDTFKAIVNKIKNLGE